MLVTPENDEVIAAGGWLVQVCFFPSFLFFIFTGEGEEDREGTGREGGEREERRYWRGREEGSEGGRDGWREGERREVVLQFNAMGVERERERRRGWTGGRAG